VRSSDDEVTVLRHRTLQMIADAGSGHPGSSLSCLHILAVLYRRVLQGVRTHERDRDRLLLSKGHGAPALYVLLQDIGVLATTSADRLRHIGSTLQGHPDRLSTVGVEASSGSLGQGLSLGVGLSLGLRRRRSSAHVYVLLGDGELQEGQVWEAAAAAAHFHLGNLTAIVDRNRFQHDGPTESVLSLEPLAGRWRSFGWQVDEIDGHDVDEIEAATRVRTPQPHVLIAHTVKGYGVPFMEGPSPWHSVKDLSLLRRYLRQEEANCA
jgi:transketolase